MLIDRPAWTRGAINLVDATRIAGWACDMSRPDVTLEVQILISSKVVATTAADLYREELNRGGIGSGEHGFEVALPDKLGGTGPIELRRADNDGVIDTWPAQILGWRFIDPDYSGVIILNSGSGTIRRRLPSSV